MYVSWQNRRSTVLLLLLLLLTTGLAWRLVQKLQGHVTHTKKTTCSVDRERNKRVSSAISMRSQTSTSSNVVWKSTVTTMMWQTTVNCSTAATGKARSNPRLCCDESLEQPWNNHRHWRAGTQTPPRADVSRAIDAVGEVHSVLLSSRKVLVLEDQFSSPCPCPRPRKFKSSKFPRTE